MGLAMVQSLSKHQRVTQHFTAVRLERSECARRLPWHTLNIIVFATGRASSSSAPPPRVRRHYADQDQYLTTLIAKHWIVRPSFDPTVPAIHRTSIMHHDARSPLEKPRGDVSVSDTSKRHLCSHSWYSACSSCCRKHGGASEDVWRR